MKVLILGSDGQDGILLKQLLSEIPYYTIKGHNKKSLDITNFEQVEEEIEKGQYDQIYNFAGISSVVNSFYDPAMTHRVNCEAVLNILEVIRKYSSHTKFFQSSTGEIFKDLIYFSSMVNSPYAVSKLAAHNYVDMYRKIHNIYAVNGIMFNHESPYRGDCFVSKKIINWCVDYSQGLTQSPLILGNIEAKRDWGSALDFVKNIYKCMQNPVPKNYIFKANNIATVKQFVDQCFSYFGIEEHMLTTSKDLYRPNNPLHSEKYHDNDQNFVYDMNFEDVVKWMCDDAVSKNQKR